MNFFNGYKTYFVGFVMILWAIYAQAQSMIGGAEATEMIFLGVAILTGRKAISDK